MCSELTGASSDNDTDMTSTGILAKLKAEMTLVELDERNNKRHGQILDELQKGNEYKATFNELFGSFIEKIKFYSMYSLNFTSHVHYKCEWRNVGAPRACASQRPSPRCSPRTRLRQGVESHRHYLQIIFISY